MPMPSRGAQGAGMSCAVSWSKKPQTAPKHAPKRARSAQHLGALRAARAAWDRARRSACPPSYVLGGGRARGGRHELPRRREAPGRATHFAAPGGGGPSACRCRRDGSVRAHGGRFMAATRQNLCLALLYRPSYRGSRPCAPRAPPPTSSVAALPSRWGPIFAKGALASVAGPLESRISGRKLAHRTMARAARAGGCCPGHRCSGAPLPYDTLTTPSPCHGPPAAGLLWAGI